MTDRFTHADIPDQSGKTFFITGANTGIGFEAARAIARAGGRVLLGCRNTDKGDDAAERIRQETPDADVAVVPIDLGDLASVRAGAELVLQEPRLDVLINNAGIMFTPRMLTQDGFEAQMGVNHLGHFALTAHLLPKLEQAPEGRVVSISSMGHRMARPELLWDDHDASRSYDPQQRYYLSKLANLLFTYELDRRLRAAGSTMKAVAAHPGGADTDLARHLPGWMQGMLGVLQPVLVRTVMNTAEQGAWPTEMAACHPDAQGGMYFGPRGLGQFSGAARQVDSNAASRDPQTQKRFWDLSVSLTGVEPRA